jgi:hypothetical protein
VVLYLRNRNPAEANSEVPQIEETNSLFTEILNLEVVKDTVLGEHQVHRRRM